MGILYYSVGSAGMLGFAELHMQAKFVIATLVRLYLGGLVLFAQGHHVSNILLCLVIMFFSVNLLNYYILHM